MTIITAILPAYNEEISVLHSKQHVGRVVVDDGSRYITIKPQMKAPRVTPLEGVTTYAYAYVPERPSLPVPREL